MDATTTPAPPRRARALRWAGRVLSVVVLVATFVVLRDRWDDLSVDAGLPGTGWVVLAVAANVVGNLLLVDAWRLAASLAGPRLGLRTAADVWGSSQMTRLLLPGAPVASRAVLAGRHGVPRGIGALTTIVEIAWMLVGAPVLALVTAPWWLSEAPASLAWVAWLAVVPVGGLVAVVAWPRRSLDLLASGLARLPVLGTRLAGTATALREAPFDRAVAVALLGRYLVNTTLRLVAFLALAAGVLGTTALGAEVAVVIGAFALGRFVGTIAVFAPGGIGPREGVTALVLGPRIGGPAALVVVGIARLVEFAAELLLLGVVRLLRLRAGSPS